jgi:hypothetical protein
MKNKLGLFKRLGVLAVLALCLAFVMMGTDSTRSASATICCQECPVNPFDPHNPSPEEYCSEQCNNSTYDCYYRCLEEVYSCWSHCDNCP